MFRLAHLPLATVLFAGSLVPCHGAVGTSCTGLKSGGVRRADTISLHAAPGVPTSVVTAGIDYWRSCRNYEVGFPALVFGGEGTSQLTIRRLTHRENAACASLEGDTITLYDWARTPSGNRFRCGSLAQNLAHELGHALGLRDAPAASRCRGQIMGRLDGANRQSRDVVSSECQALGQYWLTTSELHELEEIRRRALGTEP